MSEGVTLALPHGVIDLARGSFLPRAGASVGLTTREVALLGYVTSRPGELVDRETLYREVWGYGPDALSRALDATVARLRAKIEEDPKSPRHLITVHGEGLRWVPVQPESQPEATVPIRPPRRLGALTLDLARGVASGSGHKVNLSAIEAELLRIITDRPGQVIDRRVLRRDVWGRGGTDKALANTLSRLRAKLAPLAGSADWLESVRGRGVRVVLHATERSTNLGPARHPIVGRDGEIAALGEAFGSHRLVTLVGPVGVGKTRLAREYARSVNHHLRGGAWFVEVAEVRDAAGLCSAVASALGVALSEDDVVRQVGHALAVRGALLVVLDGVERAADVVIEALRAWQAVASESRWLFTSARGLRVPGEQMIRVDPLQAEAARRLFLQGAAPLRPELAEPRYADDIAALVERLDRLPLTIRLATARVRTLGPDDLLERLDRPFEVLRDPRAPSDEFGAVERALAGSWELLPPAARQVWAQAAVFVGSFTVEDAEAVVVRVAGHPPVWESLELLVDSHVLSVEEGPTGRRLAFLHAVRAFGRQQMSPSERDAARDRHAAWFADTLGSPLEPPYLLQDDTPLSRLLSLYDDAVVAMDWAICQGRGSLAARLAAVAARSRLQTGPYGTLVGVMDRALVLDLDTRDRLLVLVLRAAAVQRRGGLVEAIDGASEALQLAGDDVALRLVATTSLAAAEVSRDPVAAAARLEVVLPLAEVGTSMWGLIRLQLGVAAIYRGDTGPAEPHVAAAVATFRRRGPAWLLASSLLNQGALLHNLGLLQPAREAYEESLSTFDRLNDARLRASVLANLANLRHALGDDAGAAAAYQEASEAQLRAGCLPQAGITLANRGMFLVNVGDPLEGRRCLERGLELLHGTRFGFAMPGVLAALGDLDRRAGHLRRARRRFDEAEHTARAGDLRLILARLLCLRGLLDLAQGDRGAALAARGEAAELIEVGQVESGADVQSQLRRLEEALGA